ncbi:MAG TPA: MFS transporter [Planctomycetaceae bacterium]|nr:MFS transporter [Planctomycetaceae bacterium]
MNVAESKSESVVPVSDASRQLRSDLRASYGDGIAFGGMVGLGETYLSAFVLAVGLGELTAGLVASVPLVVGGLMQTVSPRAVRMLGSHKRWVVICAFLQALTFIPLVIAAYLGKITAPVVLLIAAVYWGTGLATGPAWNTWIGTVVPPTIRTRFFTIRTRASQAAVFLGFLIGGICLQLAGTPRQLMMVYASLFAVSALCRLISAFMLTRQSEPTPILPNMRLIPWKELLLHLRQRSGGQLLVYLVAVQASVQMSGPYFTPFMFRKLGMSYGQFVALISVAFLAKVIAFPYWGRVAHRIGAKRLLWIGGIGIVPLSAGWLVSGNLWWLMAIQIFGGITWAAYELAFFLLFFESIPQEERTSLLTFYNVINTLAWVGGALLGGLVLYLTEASYNGYMIVFALSSVGRCLALVLLSRLTLIDVEADEIGVRTMAVRPNTASLDAPILSSMPDQTEEALVVKTADATPNVA